jgi:hypothetical protein
MAGGNTAELLDTAEEALDQVAALVEMAVMEALDGAVLAGRDGRANLARGQCIEQFAGIMGSAGGKPAGVMPSSRGNAWGLSPA